MIKILISFILQLIDISLFNNYKFNTKIEEIRMISELERIKSKDYGQLDDRLFQNLSKTSELDQTITKLFQLQNYLKCQIDKIQDEQEKQAAMQASKIVLADVSYHYNPQKCNCSDKLREIRSEMVRMSRSFKRCVQYISKQHSMFRSDIEEIARDTWSDIESKFTKKCSQNYKLKQQIKQLQQKLKDLTEENQNLQKFTPRKKEQNYGTISKGQLSDREYLNTYNNEEPQIQKFFSKDTRSHIHSKSTVQYSKEIQQGSGNISNFYTRGYVYSQSNTPRLPMPLRKPSNTDSEDQYHQQKFFSATSLQRAESNKQLRPRNSDFCEKKFLIKNQFNDVKKQICKSNHSISSTKKRFKQESNPAEKENLMLKRKGVDMKDQRDQRKSVKKLKVFSHF